MGRLHCGAVCTHSQFSERLLRYADGHLAGDYDGGVRVLRLWRGNTQVRTVGMDLLEVTNEGVGMPPRRARDHDRVELEGPWPAERGRQSTDRAGPSARGKQESASEGVSTAWQAGALPSAWKYAAPWRQAVQRRRTMLFDDLARMGPLEAGAEGERDFLNGVLLSDADLASRAPVGVRKWWWGTEVERAWARLREVEERTIDLLPDVELRSRAADASAHATYYLKGDDKRLLHLEACRLQDAKEPSDTSRSELRSSTLAALRAAHAQADRVNQAARNLRNRLILASGMSVLSAVLLVVGQWRFDDVRFLEPPANWTGSGWAFIVIVMLFGAVGALFTAIPAMSKVPSDFSPFNLPLQQAVLKILFGPLVAVAGLAILSTDALQTGPPKSWPALLLVAIAFGAGQQAVTKYVDKRADEILSATAPAMTGTSQ